MYGSIWTEKFEHEKEEKFVDDFKGILQEVWEKLDQSIIYKLIIFMPDRMKAVLAAKRCSTKY